MHRGITPMPMARTVLHWARVRGASTTGTTRAQAVWGPRMADGGGIDGGARVRLLALVQGVRALAQRTGGSLADVRVADGAAPAVRDAVAGALARDAVATATPQDLEALAVRTAWRLGDLGSPGAGRDGTPQLRAILGRVAGPETSDREHVGSADARFVPLKPLGDYGKETLFPGKALAAGDLAVGLRATWKGFTDDHRALPATSFEGYLDSLAAALQKHAWCVPAIPVGTGPRDDRERGSNDVSRAPHRAWRLSVATSAVCSDTSTPSPVGAHSEACAGGRSTCSCWVRRWCATCARLSGCPPPASSLKVAATFTCSPRSPRLPTASWRPPSAR